MELLRCFPAFGGDGKGSIGGRFEEKARADEDDCRCGCGCCG